MNNVALEADSRPTSGDPSVPGPRAQGSQTMLTRGQIQRSRWHTVKRLFDGRYACHDCSFIGSVMDSMKHIVEEQRDWVETDGRLGVREGA